MKTTIILLSLLLFTACGASNGQNSASKKVSGLSYCSDEISSVSGQAVFVVGDSISIGYTPTLKEELNGYSVVHSPCNARYSQYGVENMVEWQAQWGRKWEICTLNHGLHDLTNTYFQGVNKYVENLTKEISIMRNYCEKIIFATTTAIPAHVVDFHTSELVDYNNAATDLMNAQGIPVCDLYATSLTIPVSEQDGIHFTSEGYRILGEELAQCINSL